MSAGDLLFPALLIAAVASVSYGFTSHDPAPLRAAPPLPTALTVQGLSVGAIDALPAWRAATARLRPPGGMLTLGGMFSALELEQVVVRMPVPGGEQLELAAAHGAWEGAELRLGGGVAAEWRGRRVMAAARMVLGRDTVRLPGVTVLWPGSSRERTERGLELAAEELVGLLADR